MNAMIGSQIKQIEGYVGQLREAIEAANKQIDALSEARDELQKKSWAQAKEIAAYKEGLEEIAHLREENEALNKLAGDFEPRLRRILAQIRSLAVEYHP